MVSKKSIVIIGLGLIGGSFAKSATKHGYSCQGYDINNNSVSAAIEDGVITGSWDPNIKADIYIVALYESATVDFIKNNLDKFAKGAVIIDICGNKRGICTKLTELCAKKDLYFVGTHPMQGRTSSGYHHSTATLFDGASMIVCNDTGTDDNAVERVREFALSINFKKIVICNPDLHDSMLSYTSQLAHILSSVYVQNEKSQSHIGYSAGSFRDLSRVAELSADMWSELMINNRDNLIKDIELYEQRLAEFKKSLADEDIANLHCLLKKGNDMKLNSKKGNN